MTHARWPTVLTLAALALGARPASAEDPPKRRSVHGLDLALPAGWTCEADPGGAFVLRHPPPAGPNDIQWNYILIVLPTQPLRGTFWETHRAIFDEVVRTSGLVNTVATVEEPNAPGPFIRSATAGDDAAGSVRPIRLCSALSEEGLECVVIYSQEDFAATGAILNGAVVRRPPKSRPRARIVEAYRRLSQQLDVNVHGGEMLVGAVPYDRIWLRADGVADFSANYPEGYAASRLPDKLDPALRNGRYGAWTAAGEKEVRIVRKSGQPPEVYLRENGNLRLGDKVFRPMPSVDGLKLEGRWCLPGAAAENPPRTRRIAFTAEGRFQDDGLLEDVGFFPVYAWAGSRVVLLPRPPPAGSGTYEIRDFTLLLKYDDGREWSADFSIFGDDPKDLSKLLLRTGILHRES